NMTRGAQILLVENVAEFRSLDDAKLLCCRELVGQHAAEIAAGAAVPPGGRSVVMELGDAELRLRFCQECRCRAQRHKYIKNEYPTKHHALLLHQKSANFTAGSAVAQLVKINNGT